MLAFYFHYCIILLLFLLTPHDKKTKTSFIVLSFSPSPPSLSLLLLLLSLPQTSRRERLDFHPQRSVCRTLQSQSSVSTHDTHTHMHTHTHTHTILSGVFLVKCFSAERDLGSASSSHLGRQGSVDLLQSVIRPMCV